MVPENVKKIIKDKTIEDIIPKLLPKIKSEKDILSMKTYMTWFVKFLAAFTYNEEGIKAIMIHNTVFDLVLFWLENLTPPSPKESDTILQFFINSMLFFSNSSAFRKNKLHFLSNPKFLTNVITILNSTEYPLKIKAFAAQTLSVCLHNHQGVKSAWNKQICEGISMVRSNLEAYDETTDDEMYRSLHFADQTQEEEFIQLQGQYKQVCLEVLANLQF